MKNLQLGDLFLSFREIWKYDKRLLFIMIADVIVDAVSPFPNIIFAGLIVDNIVGGEGFPEGRPLCRIAVRQQLPYHISKNPVGQDKGISDD